MQAHTAAAISALLKTDPTITAEDRARLLSPDKTAPTERIVRLREVTQRLGVTRRTVSNLLSSGALTAVYLPGRVRAYGVRESALLAMMDGKSGKAA